MSPSHAPSSRHRFGSSRSRSNSARRRCIGSCPTHRRGLHQCLQPRSPVEVTCLRISHRWTSRRGLLSRGLQFQALPPRPPIKVVAQVKGVVKVSSMCRQSRQGRRQSRRQSVVRTSSMCHQSRQGVIVVSAKSSKSSPRSSSKCRQNVIDVSSR